MTVATISGRTESSTIPIGTILPWPHSSTAPSGWLLCSSQEVPIASYYELYNIITNSGATFPFGANTNGSGAAGSTHFKLPNLNGGAYMPRSPSTTTPPSGATSNVGTTVAATTHTHTWDLGSSATQSTADGSHNHNVTKTVNNATMPTHTSTTNIGSTTTNTASVNVNGTGGALAGVAFRVHDHGSGVETLNVHTHSGAASNTTTNYGPVHAHNASDPTGGNINATNHTHTYTTGSDVYTPTAINAFVDHLSTRYIILAKAVK